MKLTEKIHLLKIDFDIQISPDKRIPRFVNVILVFSDKITLIDTGVKGSEKSIFDYIKKQKRDYSEIDSIILSHSHPDHIGGAAEIKRLTNCRIYAHEAEKDWIENIDLQFSQRPVPGFYNLVDKPVKIDHFLGDNQELMIERDLNLRIIESPGHSRGSISILFINDRILFTADSIPLKGDIPNYDNYLQLCRSLEAIKKNADYDILLSSWTSPVFGTPEIQRLIDEGRGYIDMIDSVVKECYGSNGTDSLVQCRSTIEKLGLPLFLVTPITDMAFRSHLNREYP